MPKKFIFRSVKPFLGLIHEWRFYPDILSIQFFSWAANPATPSEPFTDKPVPLPKAEFDGLLACTRENLQFTDATPPEIEPINEVGPFKTGNLCDLSREQIQNALGFPPNIRDDPFRIRWSWGFTVNGERCAIWDYKLSADDRVWSTFGPAWCFKLLFDKSHVHQ